MTNSMQMTKVYHATFLPNAFWKTSGATISIINLTGSPGKSSGLSLVLLFYLCVVLDWLDFEFDHS